MLVDIPPQTPPSGSRLALFRCSRPSLPKKCSVRLEALEDRTLPAVSPVAPVAVPDTTNQASAVAIPGTNLTFNPQATNSLTSGTDLRSGQDLLGQGFGSNLTQALLSTPTTPSGSGLLTRDRLGAITGAPGTRISETSNLPGNTADPLFRQNVDPNNILLTSVSRPATLASYSFALMANLRPADLLFAQFEPNALLRGGYPYATLSFGRGGSTPGVVQNERAREFAVQRALAAADEMPGTEELAEPDTEEKSREEVAPKHDSAVPAEGTSNLQKENQMSEQATTTTPDPELYYPVKQPGDTLAGENARGEVAGCPTGLGNAEQPQTTQRSGGGGAPTTGAVDVSVPPSPGEGVKDG